MPIHGEYKHLLAHAAIAHDLGMKNSNIFTLSNGQVLEIDHKGAKIGQKVPSGRIFVDGLGVGDVGNVVIRDRKHLSEDGLFVVVVTIDSDDGKLVSGPDIISRGFVYVREAEDLLEGAKKAIKNLIENTHTEHLKDWSHLKSTIKNVLDEYLYEKTKRKPMVLPVIIEV